MCSLLRLPLGPNWCPHPKRGWTGKAFVTRRCGVSRVTVLWPRLQLHPATHACHLLSLTLQFQQIPLVPTSQFAHRFDRTATYQNPAPSRGDHTQHACRMQPPSAFVVAHHHLARTTVRASAYRPPSWHQPANHPPHMPPKPPTTCPTPACRVAHQIAHQQPILPAQSKARV